MKLMLKGMTTFFSTESALGLSPKISSSPWKITNEVE
jgi:hypothetical protein